jgi:hypothetical protein
MQYYRAVYFNIQWSAQGLENRIIGWIWDSRDAPLEPLVIFVAATEENSVQGCNAVQYTDTITFQKNMGLPFSGSMNKPSSVCRLLLLVSCVAYSSSSETSACLRTTRHYNPEDRTFQDIIYHHWLCF